MTNFPLSLLTCLLSLAITLQNIEAALRENVASSSSLPSSLSVEHKPRYYDLPNPFVYSDQIISSAKRIIHLQRHQSSESTEQFEIMIREFCKKDGIHRMAAEHLINIFSMLCPSFSPLSVTSRSLLSLYSTQPLSSYVTSTLSEHCEYLSQANMKSRKRGTTSSSQFKQTYLSITTNLTPVATTSPVILPIPSQDHRPFSSLDVMTCAIVPTFLSSHEQTIGNLVSLSSFLPNYPADELSILILPSTSCFFISPLRLELLLCLPSVTESLINSPVPNLVSRTLICLHGLVSRSLMCFKLSHLEGDSFDDSIVDVDLDCVSTIRTYRHSILHPVLQTCLEHYLRLLFFCLQHGDLLDPMLSPLIELAVRYISVCFLLLEECFSPTDCCVTIMESLFFEKSFILAFISFSLPHQRQKSSGKSLALSILLKCGSILMTNFPHQQALNPMILCDVISLLELFHCEDNLVDYSPACIDKLSELIQQGKEIISLYLFAFPSPQRQDIDMERIIYREGKQFPIQQQNQSTPRITVVRYTQQSIQVCIQVAFSLPQRLHQKKKGNSCLEKINIAIIPFSDEKSLTHQSSLSISLSPRIILRGYLSLLLSHPPHSLLSLDKILFLSNYLSEFVSIHSLSLVPKEWYSNSSLSSHLISR